MLGWLRFVQVPHQQPYDLILNNASLAVVSQSVLRRYFFILSLALCADFVYAEASDDYLLDWVVKKAQERNVRFGTRPFEQIGWAENIESALELAQEHTRPVFLFTLDGYFATGRC